MVIFIGANLGAQSGRRLLSMGERGQDEVESEALNVVKRVVARPNEWVYINIPQKVPSEPKE